MIGLRSWIVALLVLGLLACGRHDDAPTASSERIPELTADVDGAHLLGQSASAPAASDAGPPRGASAAPPSTPPAPGTPEPPKRPRDATTLSLDWLKAHQDDDGSWDPVRFAQTCRDGEASPDLHGPGHDARRVKMTALALHAFLGAGYTHRGTHPYKHTVSRTLRWIRSWVAASADFGLPDDPTGREDLAFLALAVAEFFGMTETPLLRGPVERVLQQLHGRTFGPEGIWARGIPVGADPARVAWIVLPFQVLRYHVREAARREVAMPWALEVPGVSDEDPLWRDLDRWVRETATDAVDRTAKAPTPASLRWAAALAWLRNVTQPKAWDDATARALRAHLRAGAALAADDARPLSLETRALALIAMLTLDWKALHPWRQGPLGVLRAAQRSDGTVCTVRGTWDPVGPEGTALGRVGVTAWSLWIHHRTSWLPYSGPVRPR